LNPGKCTFSVQKGKILGCIVSAKEIGPNPDKVQAILNKKVPENIKDIQKLTGILATLNRFCRYFKHSREQKETSHGDLRNNMHLKK
jgi:hypothetical protein